MGQVGGVSGTELAGDLQVGMAGKTSFRNISEGKAVIEIQALSQFSAVHELLG